MCCFRYKVASNGNTEVEYLRIVLLVVTVLDYFSSCSQTRSDTCGSAVNLNFAHELSSVLHVISCDKTWWSKLGEATESLHKFTGNFAAAQPAAGARWSAAVGAERSFARETGSVCPPRVCTRWVCVGSHCGQWKWLPKTAGRLPAACRPERGADPRPADQRATPPLSLVFV